MQSPLRPGLLTAFPPKLVHTQHPEINQSPRVAFLLIGGASRFALGKRTVAVALWVSLMPRIWGDCLPRNLSSLTGPRKLVNFQPIQLLLVASLGALTAENESPGSSSFIIPRP